MNISRANMTLDERCADMALQALLESQEIQYRRNFDLNRDKLAEWSMMELADSIITLRSAV